MTEKDFSSFAHAINIPTFRYVRSNEKLNYCLPPPSTPTGSSGVYLRTGLPPNSYTLRVVASVRSNTSQRAVLRKSIRIFPKGMCSVSSLGPGVVVNGTRATVEFVGSDSVVDFQCRIDNHQPVPCKHLRMTHLCTVFSMCGYECRGYVHVRTCTCEPIQLYMHFLPTFKYTCTSTCML